MSTDTFRPSVLAIFTILSLVTLAPAQICFEERTTMMTINNNGRFENVPIKTMVKECCEGYSVDKNNPQLCVSICQAGFVHERGSCIPSCDKCENGECLAPDECKCNEGYTESGDGCSPICHECLNSVCVKPGVCECKEDFVSTPDGCVPRCDGCENGFCLKPGECQCASGYKMSIRDFKCKPKCKKRCENGFCSGPNECTCHQGYRKLTLNEHVCVPRMGDVNNDVDDDDNDDDEEKKYDNNDDNSQVVERKLRKLFNIPAKKSFLLVVLKI